MDDEQVIEQELEPTDGDPSAEPQDTGAEPEEVEEGTEETTADPAADAQEKEKGVQKRIDELTRKRREAERDAQYWREQAMKAQRPEPEQQADFVPPGFPQKPQVDQFETYEDFVEAIADWKSDLKLAQRDHKTAQEREQDQRKTQTEKYAERVTKFVEAQPDFDEVLANTTAPATKIMENVIIESDHGPEIAYFLAKNEAEAARIASLPPHRQLIEMGKLEARMEKRADTPPPQKRMTQAPEPIKPLGTVTPTAKKDPSQMTDAEFNEWRRKSIARKH